MEENRIHYFKIVLEKITLHDVWWGQRTWREKADEAMRTQSKARERRESNKWTSMNADSYHFIELYMRFSPQGLGGTWRKWGKDRGRRV